jgi:hypothetical protein
MSTSNVVEGDADSSSVSQGTVDPNDVDNPSNWVEDVELVTNKRQYLIEAVRVKAKEEFEQFVLYKALLEQVESMGELPTSARDVVHSKDSLVAELTDVKDKHLRQHHFFDQLLGIMLRTPLTEETVSNSFPPIYRPVFYDPDGNKRYL